MKCKLILISIFSIYFLNSCNKSDNSEFTDTPIVEAYLKPGESPVVKIRRQLPFSSNVNYSSDSLNDLDIRITNNNLSYKLVCVGDSQYTSKSLIIKEGERYDLSFSFNNRNVYAYTNVPSRPKNFTESVKSISLQKTDSTSAPQDFSTMPQPVYLNWDNSDGSYYIVLIENMATTLVPIRSFGNRVPPNNRFRKAPTTASGLELRPMEFQYFGKHRLILFHVLPDYAALYNQQQSSSLNLTNPSTSIMNGYGIFTGLNSDTLYIDVNQSNK
jgi:hypothetical protein